MLPSLEHRCHHNRALVYVLLTGLLLAIYIGSVILLRNLFFVLTGQRSELALIISMLMSAALFQPLLHRLRQFIDRRFYRRKHEAAQALALFNARLRDEVDPPTLTQDLVQVVRETVQPATVSLWLREPPGMDA